MEYRIEEGDPLLRLRCSIILLRAFSGFGAISRLPMGIFRILKWPNPFQDLEIAQDIFEIAQGHFYD